MATGIINIVKIASNILRSRTTLVHGIPEVYRPAFNRKREKLIELIKEKADIASKSELARKIRAAKGFYTLEMSPPGMNEMQKIIMDLATVKEFFLTKCYKQLTVKQAWLLFLVAWEVSLWFFLGETIGKMHIVGYSV